MEIIDCLLTEVDASNTEESPDLPWTDGDISLSESGNSSRTMINSISSLSTAEGATDSATEECTGEDYK